MKNDKESANSDLEKMNPKNRNFQRADDEDNENQDNSPLKSQNPKARDFQRKEDEDDEKKTD